VRVVLVRPRGGANVGAVCRAMKNMGTGDLALVTSDFDREQARRMAVHAGDVLWSAREVDTLSEAVAGCTTVVGTTCRPGSFRRRARDIRDLAAELVRLPMIDCGRPVALLFGAEDTGLTNNEVAFCHHLAYIPAASAYPSLNLAQAVLLCLYELRRHWWERDGAVLSHPVQGEDEPRQPADAAAVESMLGALEQALTDIGFLAERGSSGVMATIRALLTRSGLDVREVRILHGIARQIRWFGAEGHEVVREKRQRGEKLR